MASRESNTVVSEVACRYLRFHLTSDIGPIRLRRLREHFGSLDAILGASMSQLEEVEGIGPRIAESILRSRCDGLVEQEVERAHTHSLQIICAEDPDYPRPLLSMTDPPICLYVRGRMEPQDAVAVAIVGTRRCSHYGREQARRFGEVLGSAGFTVISGLARGIDGHAHTGALQGGGRTIAVLGNGLPSIYPPEHESLAADIENAGAVLTEVPIAAKPSADNFPRRNRIIAGLSLGVIIIEAGKGSGALITARLANEYNREVFAVPGRVDRPELTAGSHALIRDGEAKLITNLEDVLDELGGVGEVMARDQPTDANRAQAGAPAPGSMRLSDPERAVWDLLEQDINDADSIVAHCALDTAQVMSALTSLQLKGLVQRLPGQRFVRRNAT